MGIITTIKNKFKKPEGRVEGVEKVTGNGKYAAEYEVKNVCYGVLVDSAIPSGRIKSILVDKAKQVEGVIDIMTHLNRPDVPAFATPEKLKESRFGLPVFHTDRIYFKGQPIALVIAETLEDAVFAASLVEAEYQKDDFAVDFADAKESVSLQPEGKERGSMESWKNMPFIVDEQYTIKENVHHPMEMHTTIAQWTGKDTLRLYDKTQGVNNVQKTFAALLGIPKENIEVFSEFVGGGFGSGLRVWPHALAAVLAAKQLNRPVKVTLTRSQMFAGTGYRPASWQRIRLGADQSGNLSGIIHQAKNGTSKYEKFSEGITRVTRMIYKLPNLKTESAVVPLNLSTPTWMRGPGDCSGVFALECAVDELSYKLKMDPVELHLKNISLDKHPDSGLPWSTHFLDKSLKIGAKMIGWKSRKAVPESIADGDWYTGYGMAVGMWNAGRREASASIIMHKDGSITVQTAMTDIGTGTGTGMQNIAHTITGIPKDKISIQLGNSALPPAPSQGGSTGLSSVSGAVYEVSNQLKVKLAEYASAYNPGFKGISQDDILLSDTGISLKNNKGTFVSYQDIFQKNNMEEIRLEVSSKPGADNEKYAFCSSAAHFCKVRVNKRTGRVKVEKFVVVGDGGTIINNQAAANQMSGAAVGGIGMALMEESQIDSKLGILIGNDLAGYHFSVNADAPVIEVAFINKPDPRINPSGAKGLGEVGIIGTAPAISNAIYNAIGVRMRDLPITPDKILMAMS